MVHNEEGPFGLSAQHALLGLAFGPEEVHVRFNVAASDSASHHPVSGRYLNGDVNCANIGWFTHHDLHLTQDIAKFHVNVEHGFAVCVLRLAQFLPLTQLAGACRVKSRSQSV